jgi:hypothetical protein
MKYCYSLIFIRQPVILIVNGLFLLKSDFTGTLAGKKEKPSPKIDTESSLVDKRFEISNQNLARDITLIIEPGEIGPSFE